MSITLVTVVVTTNTLCHVFWVIYGVAFVSHKQEKKESLVYHQTATI